MKKTIIRKVWAFNLESEFQLIRELIDHYSFVSVDTEFPGFVFRPEVVDRTKSFRGYDPSFQYIFLKTNVDALKLIQVGITLTDSTGKLPDLGMRDQQFIWEFNFCDFNIAHDAYVPESIAFLQSQGVDFDRNVLFGAHTTQFAELMVSSGLVFNHAVTWVTFHGAFDFGYMVKILTGRFLPARLEDFLSNVIVIFGKQIYDVKHMIRYFNGLYGGLKRVARILNVDQVSHQPDSLLTWNIFQKIKETYFVNNAHLKYGGVLFGLELTP